MSVYPYAALPRYYVEALHIHTEYHEVGRGNGRPIVLLHGMSTSADSFREILHELGEDHWLVAPDLPGFGYSDHTEPYTIPHLVEWLAAFVEKLGLIPTAVVGHSFGGLLATSFTLTYPEDVTQLLLCAPAITSVADFPEFLRRASISLGLIDLGTAVTQSPLWLNRQIKIPFYDPEQQHESLWARRLLDYANARASADVVKALAFHDLRSELGSIRQPVCLVWGQNDPVLPVANINAIAPYLPNVRVHTLPNCGHAPMLEQQAQFQAITRQFFNPREKTYG